MSPTLSRRSFLEFSAFASATALASCAAPASRTKSIRTSGRLRHAGIAVGGMGGADLDQIRSHPDVDIVALCDVDSNNLKGASERCPGARTYRDWRELLEKERGNIDSVHVSTPDHMHAPITLAALRLGLHVYCQKPLTRTVREARAVARAAKEAGVVTQMGIQNHSNPQYDAARQLFRKRPVGRIHEVHVWTDRPAGWWPQGIERAAGEDPVPDTLDWDKWLGTAPLRPFKQDTYHAFRWRGIRDFGTGAQGDMACHLMDPALWFLGLGDPLRVRSVGPRPTAESFPLWSEIRYEFPGNEWTTRGPVLVTWRDGGKTIPKDLMAELGLEKITGNGCLFVGEDGALLADPYGVQELLPREPFKNVKIPEGRGVNHWHQWVDACLGRGEASAPFEYAAHLTEVALLGNIALNFPHETLEWDGGKGRFRGRPDADALLGSPQRKGWEIPELAE